jgi:hypothetical protein
MCVERTRCFCKPDPKRLASSHSPSSTMLRGIVDASPPVMHPEASPPKNPARRESTTAHRPPTSSVILSKHNSDGPGRQYLRPRCRKESYAALRRKNLHRTPMADFRELAPRPPGSAPATDGGASAMRKTKVAVACETCRLRRVKVRVLFTLPVASGSGS